MIEPSIGEPRGNRAVEDAAVAFVIDYELRAGRLARDTRGHGAAADVESVGRVIEVKAAGGSARGADLWLEPRQVEEAGRNPSFHLYVVDNVRQGDPRQFGLVDLYGEQLQVLLQRAKEQRYYTMPFPVAVYDTSRHVPGHEGRAVPSSTVPSRERTVDPHVDQMSRTSAIVHVLTARGGPMRPVDVWAELRRLGRTSDPKGDVSTTMYDLWKSGRIDRPSRGRYQALSSGSSGCYLDPAAELGPPA